VKIKEWLIVGAGCIFALVVGMAFGTVFISQLETHRAVENYLDRH
jgi:hypothetical protein